MLKAIDDKFGIVRGHVETVHSFTNDQNLIDNFHKGDRRGRSAPLNMVITETGAAKAVAKALPELKAQAHRQLDPRSHPGRVDRDPAPELERDDDQDEVNDYLRQMSLHSQLRQQIDYIDRPTSSPRDFVGSRRAGDRGRPRDHRRRHNRDPLRLVRQRVRLLLPGRPGRPAHLGHRVPDVPEGLMPS